MDRKIKQTTMCHEKAMHLCDVGDMLKRFGKFNLARKMYHRAYILESYAARIARELGVEPSASILEKSAESIRDERSRQSEIYSLSSI